MKRSLIVMGNWKMNGTRGDNESLLRELIFESKKFTSVEMAVCPPSVFIDAVAQQVNGSSLRVGAQDLCEQTKPGAFTGEVLGTMLKELGCRYVLVGHSERRHVYGETDQRVAEKFAAALHSGLVPVLCVGETLAEREAGETEAVLDRQLDAVLNAVEISGFRTAVIAYEPVWAIGTGKTATPEQAQAAHAHLRGRLTALDAKIGNSISMLYGGSVNAGNAAELFAQADVDGGLVGGASLKATEFLAICGAAQALHDE
jgi:triosephosphate isomerase (TIM)